MDYKRLMPAIYLLDGNTVTDFDNKTATEQDPVELAKYYSDAGADAIFVFGLSDTDNGHEADIAALKEMARNVDIPLYAGGRVKRVEDIKKYLYAGASKAILNYAKQSNLDLTEEVSKRFGKDKIAVSIDNLECLELNKTLIEEFVSEIVYVYVDKVEDMNQAGNLTTTPVQILWNSKEDKLVELLQLDNVAGICTKTLDKDADFLAIKALAKNAGIPMNLNEPTMVWSDFKLNSDGLLPVIVQDYKTDEVLMMAYMNEEAYNNTIATGRMTYYSRSRQELWVKGLTSGHFQYVKSLTIDCDNDTMLAKVSQVGAACHTGNRSCFYRNIIEKEYANANPLKVFEDVYNVIADRKENPKDGSYTNYLFEKGIDKILKKVGEEATEIVIAAKNPDPEEIKYEMSDFLYHAMVLMVERGITWQDITKELANR